MDRVSPARFDIAMIPARCFVPANTVVNGIATAADPTSGLLVRHGSIKINDSILGILVSIAGTGTIEVDHAEWCCTSCTWITDRYSS